MVGPSSAGPGLDAVSPYAPTHRVAAGCGMIKSELWSIFAAPEVTVHV